MSYSWAGGSTRRWRRTRAAILARDGHRCRINLEGVCTGLADCVHHLFGRAVTGDDPRWLVASCTACNLKIGDPTSGEPQPRVMTRW